MSENVYHYYAVDENTAYGALASDGRLVTTIEVKDSIPQLLIEHLNSGGYNVSEIQPDIVQLEPGSIVPSWGDYIVV